MIRSALSSQHFSTQNTFMSLYNIAQRHLTTLEAKLDAATTREECDLARLEISRVRTTIAAAERLMR